MKRTTAVLAILIGAAITIAFCRSGAAEQRPAIELAQAAETGTAEGEVRRVDKETKKITIRHGPVAGTLEMSAMSMVLVVSSEELLDKLKVGDKVRFTVSRENGTFVLQAAEVVK